MQGIFTRCVVAVGAGLVLIVSQGCKKQAAPAPMQQVVSSSGPQVQPNFRVGPLPFEEDVDSGAMPRVMDREAPRRQPVQPVQVQVQRADVQAAAVAEAQRLQDARLLQEQEAASERQQEELNQEIEQDVRRQEEMEAEPRIQDIPEVPTQAAPLESTQPQ